MLLIRYLYRIVSQNLMDSWMVGTHSGAFNSSCALALALPMPFHLFRPERWERRSGRPGRPGPSPPSSALEPWKAEFLARPRAQLKPMQSPFVCRRSLTVSHAQGKGHQAPGVPAAATDPVTFCTS